MQLQNECNDEEFAKIMKDIKVLNLKHMVEDMVIYQIKYHMRQSVAPAFWKKFLPNVDKQQGFEQFKSAVDGLYTRMTDFLPLLKRLEYLLQEDSVHTVTTENDILNRFKLIVRSTLLSQIPLDYEYVVEQFYKIAFNVFCCTDNSTQGN